MHSSRDVAWRDRQPISVRRTARELLIFAMSLIIRRLLVAIALLGSAVAGAAGPLLISEVMYHPPGTNVLEEWFELRNPNPEPVGLTGWKVTQGVKFTFPPGAAIAGNGYLVVAADLTVFNTKHPGITNLVGGWAGTLGDNGDTVEIQDSLGATQASLSFANEGDWAVRRLSAPDKYGKSGWEWHTLHDGGGSSAELVNEALPGNVGQNWLPSQVVGGTPGQPNSVAAVDTAPLITELHHYPAVPRSTENVTVSVRLVDELTKGVQGAVHWRPDTATAFTSVPLVDDGAHGDGLGNDGVFGAILPPQANGAVIEFYVTAVDAAGNSRTLPNFVSAGETRSPYLVYQVDDSAYAGSQPIYKLVASRTEKAFLENQIWNGSTLSDAEINGTFIAADGVVSSEGTPQVRYLVSFRNRGHGTRSSVPHNFLVKFPDDRLWKHRSALNLNSQSTPGQTLGSAIFRALGITMAESHLAQVRWNGVNLAAAGAPQWGSYAANEPIDGALLDRQIPGDAGGNIYRGIRSFDTSITPNLVWHGTDFNNYTNAYFKQNNSLANDWSDFIRLLDVLNNTPTGSYVSAVNAAVNIPEWMRYFAINSLLDNQETCLGTGVGDDFILYLPTQDRRAQVWSYDMDSILGGGTQTTATSTSIFKMADLATVSRMVKQPEFVAEYYRQLQELDATFFDPPRFDAFIDQWRGQLESTPAIEQLVKNLKAYNASRVALVRAQIPSRLTVVSTLPVSSGYPRSTTATTLLHGDADAAHTTGVRVNGVDASYTAWQGRWTNNAVALHPGVNRILVEAVGPTGAVVASQSFDVWWDDGAVAAKGGTIGANETWAAANGPFQINSSLTIPAGVTVTIEPGTSVYLAAGVNVTVAPGGRLLAEGTADAPIWWGRSPGVTAKWGGIVIDGGAGSPETRLVHVYIEGNGTTGIHSSGGTLLLDYVKFGTTDQQYVSLDSSSFVVSHCFFPTPTAAFEPLHGTGGIKAGGHGLFLRNFIGAPNGYNDVIDFTGGNRPGQPLAHFIGNVLIGGGDDGLDLDGTDAWVEGNIFLHIHRNGAPDSSAGVSGGNTGADTSEVTIINNLFFDCDQAATAKQGDFFSLIGNTMVRTTRQGGVDFASGIVNVRDTTPDLTTPGKGFYLEGNIITDAEQLVRNPTAGALVTFVNNLLPVAWDGPGAGNRVLPAVLNHVPSLAETQFTNWESAQILWQWLAAAPGSPARGTGLGGHDLGAFPALGVMVSGEPDGITKATEATLVVGPNRSGDSIPLAGFPQGSGYIAYRWRLDGGPWSAETPIAQAIGLTGLAPGEHFVEVSGKRDSGMYQDDPLLADAAVVSRSRTWTVDPNFVTPNPGVTIRLNEILAANLSTVTNAGVTPDVVELHNYGTAPVDLSGVSLSDNVSLPRKFTFPAGTTIAADGYLVLWADNVANAPGLHLGFSLKASGDNLILTDSATRGGAVLDAVQFGIQTPDLSVGRGYDGAWTLGQPTLGAPNRPVALGDPTRLRINEWLASAIFTSGNDFVELYNADTRPVALGGLRLSDAAAEPDRSVIPPLSFIAAQGYVRLVADGSIGQGADHLSFKLPADDALLRLSDPADRTLDLISYGPQRTDISQGRSPDGTSQVVSFGQPTPGGPNPGGVQGNCTLAVQTIPLLGLEAPWRYQQTANLDGTAWRNSDYNDAGWPVGAGLLGVEDCNCLPAPGLKTILTLGRTTYYFRTHFTVNTNLAGFTANLTTVLDDGAVIYLNGTEWARPGMPSGAVNYGTFSSRNVGNGATEFLSLPSNLLVPGDNTLAVEVHQSGTASSDIVWGATLEATRTYTNCATLSSSPVILNEVFARNLTRTNLSGVVADWIELLNPATEAASLGGMSLTDDPAVPRKWVIPDGVSLAAGKFFTVMCDPLGLPSSGNTGFGLNGSGGSIFLFDQPGRGGALLDALYYGVQAGDFAMGRVSDGAPAWLLTVPTEGAANTAAALGNPAFSRINEWMADPSTGEDWFEVFNGDTRPVSLGGLYFTDNFESPFMSPIAPLSFLGVGSDAYRQFWADGKPGAGANHANFSLKKSGEAIGLYTVAGQLLDGVTFGPQLTAVSQGRFPDGTGAVVGFPGASTPGAPNTLVVVTDADGDGLPDVWEVAHGLDPHDPSDASKDPDGDGLSNLAEYLAGTDPRNANSVLRLEVEVGAEVALKFPGVTGRAYTIQYLDALGTGGWTKLIDVQTRGADGPVVLADSNPNAVVRFYRVVTPIQ